VVVFCKPVAVADRGVLELPQVYSGPAGIEGYADHLGTEKAQDPLGEQVLGIGECYPVAGIHERAQHGEQATLGTGRQDQVPLGVDVDRQQCGDRLGAPAADVRPATVRGVGGRPGLCRLERGFLQKNVKRS
jgi:hypothetical protein